RESPGRAIVRLRPTAPDPWLNRGSPSTRIDMDPSPPPASPLHHIERFDVGIVQLDADTLAVESAAQVLDPTAGALLSPARALEVARSAFPLFTDWQVPLLGWRPCRESFDSFRPLWVVAHTAGQVYVDQSGRAFARLTIGRGGA
ncbi:MAG: hypothetical protein LW847_12600, partial [Burkholderiales bacterium]|nr:hypothetical protein [Burkholderiales bacterium]